MEQIHIKISDSLKLKSGPKQMTFNEGGGYIGSGSECQWVVQDVFNTINEKHVYIRSNGDSFCLMPYKGSKVYMNGDHSPIITSYYIVLSVGDTFKIGDIEFSVVSESELDEFAEEVADSAISEIKEYNKLDNYTLVPDGQMEGLATEEDISLEDLVNDNKDVLGIEDTYTEIHNNNEVNVLQNQIITKDILKEYIINECNTLLDSDIKKQSSLVELLSKEKNRLSTKDLSHIISNFNLINNTKVINLLVISMLFKELDSPLFNEIEQDGFDKIISSLIKNASSDQNSIERLVVHAVKKYAGE